MIDMERSRTLLIIDDEKDVCMLLRRALRRRFEKVECVHSLTDGKAMAAKLHPDVILLDNNLPDGYGLEHIGKFKNVFKPPRIVVISAMDLRIESLAAGADDFIGKPVDLQDLGGIA